MPKFEIISMPFAQGHLALGPAPMAKDDWGLLKDFHPDIILTLQTSDEMTQLGNANLHRHAKDMGANWLHFPIDDYGTPRSSQMDLWASIENEILTALSQGARVFVHCRGGCGRSGMIVLRLLRAGGFGAAALDQLRAARPCAIETDDQMAWALGGP